VKSAQCRFVLHRHGGLGAVPAFKVQQVPAGVITKQTLSAHDWYSSFAALAGASDKVPADRRWTASAPPASARCSCPLFGRISLRILRMVRKAP
jgi:hypothetical protein